MYYGMVFTSSLHHGFDKALGAVMAAFATLNTHAADLRLREIETFCSPIAFGLLFVKVNLKLSRKLVRKSETF
jgi:hypothetical protein